MDKLSSKTLSEQSIGVQLVYFLAMKNAQTPYSTTGLDTSLMRRSRDLNPGAGYPAYSLSRGAPSATWVLLLVKKAGGERGIRTPGTFRYHWFSRPAPSTARPSLHINNQLANPNTNSVPLSSSFFRSRKFEEYQDSWIYDS